MTKETLEKAKEIDSKISNLYETLKKLENGDCEFSAWYCDKNGLTQAFDNPIKILIKNEIDRLEEELKSL